MNKLKLFNQYPKNKIIPYFLPDINSKEIISVNKVLRSKWLTMGRITFDFEKKFENFLSKNSKNKKKIYCIATSSATAALHLCLDSLGIKKGDEVIIPTNTFVSSIEVIELVGAKPVLCDIDYESHNLNINSLLKKITPKTKIIMPVHYAGRPCEMRLINKIAKRYKIKIIEDAAHSLPSSFEKNMIGNSQNLVCFSFYANKTLTTGEGGMISTKNLNLFKILSKKRLHGISRNAWNRYSSKGFWQYDVTELGYKYNPTDISSAIGIIQLDKLNKNQIKRVNIAKRYMKYLNEKVILPPKSNFEDSSWHLFVIKVKYRNKLSQILKKEGIGHSMHYIPIHRLSYYRKKYNFNKKDYPISEKVYKASISLPIYPSLKKKEQFKIINTINLFIDEYQT